MADASKLLVYRLVTREKTDKICLEESNTKKSDDDKLKPKTAKEWLNEHYKEKKEIKELDISDEELEGELVLGEFNELKYLICCGNKLTKIDLKEKTQFLHTH